MIFAEQCSPPAFLISWPCNGVEKTFQSSLNCQDLISCLLTPCELQHSDWLMFQLFFCFRTHNEAQKTHCYKDVQGQDRRDVHWSERVAVGQQRRLQKKLDPREARPTTYCVNAKLVTTVSKALKVVRDVAKWLRTVKNKLKKIELHEHRYSKLWHSVLNMILWRIKHKNKPVPPQS